MAADMAEFLWRKSLNALKEAETELFFHLTLASHFRRIKQVMESKNIKICSSQASSICDVLYDLNDVLVECQSFAHQRKAHKKNRILFILSMDHRFVGKRKKRLDDIKKRFEEMVVDGEGQSSPLRNSPLKFREGNGSEILGFDDKIKEIESMLFENISNENGVECKIIGLWGMGGTGKSTLASKGGEKDMGIKIFKLMLKELDYDIDELKADDITMMELSQTLQCLLSYERYLIVFDDVWLRHANVLARDFSSAGVLPRGCNGTVIVTTRLQKVATRFGAEKIHLPPPLMEQGCWNIFEHTVKSGLCNKSEIGFDQCLQKIEDEVQEDGFKLIGICGVRDARKTTLARKVFDSVLSRKFSRKIWVRLSGIQKNEQDIGAKLLKLVLEGLDYDLNESIIDDDLTVIELLDTLQHLLSNENYLIVFDDVWPWHAKFLAEETISSGGLPRNSGGAVIVTCRRKEVAEEIGCMNVIHLQHPELEDCGKIFQRTLQYDPETWKRIKIEIECKIGDLPLAAKTLGEIFLGKIRESEISSPTS
ncbi:hypothetical protein D5086_024408 [Populus alba]|uniref:Uncharacterized protein n=1 Tax=Populus alba TaxID=43335 RepID=A0ACC4B5N8_POPAL